MQYNAGEEKIKATRKEIQNPQNGWMFTVFDVVERTMKSCNDYGRNS